MQIHLIVVKVGQKDSVTWLPCRSCLYSVASVGNPYVLGIIWCHGLTSFRLEVIYFCILSFHGSLFEIDCKRVLTLVDNVLISLMIVLCILVELSLRIFYSLNVFLVSLFGGTCFCREGIPIGSHIGIQSQIDQCYFSTSNQLRCKVQRIVWCAVIYYVWYKHNIHVHGVILCHPQVINLDVQFEIFIYCSK